jgi:predicted esterase
LAALVAARAGVEVNGLLLCAPALQLDPPPGFEEPIRTPAPTTIIHGTRDEVIPIDVSRAFCRAHGATLIEVDDDHSLAASLTEIVDAVRKMMPGEP